MHISIHTHPKNTPTTEEETHLPQLLHRIRHSLHAVRVSREQLSQRIEFGLQFLESVALVCAVGTEEFRLAFDDEGVGLLQTGFLRLLGEGAEGLCGLLKCQHGRTVCGMLALGFRHLV